jgi:hypothetical protein
MTNREMRLLIGIVIINLPLWLLNRSGHYKCTGKFCKYTKAPGWLRKIFGDFRKQGDLVIRNMIIQLIIYVISSIAIVITLTSDLTKYAFSVLVVVEYLLFGVSLLLITLVDKSKTAE